MPPRKTITFSSDAAAEDLPEDKIFVYYCKYSGRHAMTTDCDIEKLPRRATDGAMVLDRTKYIVRLYTADGGVKYVKRDEGDTTAERQYRLQVGPLPVAYTTEVDGPLLYILPGALSSYSDESERLEIMVPPCIIAAEGGVQMMLDFEDRQKLTKVLKITADGIRMSIRNTLDGLRAKDEIFEFFGKVLNRQFKHFQLMRGLRGLSSKVLMVEGITPEQCYGRVFDAVKKSLVIKDRKVEPQAVALV